MLGGPPVDWRPQKQQKVLSTEAEMATNTGGKLDCLPLGLGWKRCMEPLLQKAGPAMNLPPTCASPATGAPQPPSPPAPFLSDCPRAPPSTSLALLCLSEQRGQVDGGPTGPGDDRQLDGSSVGPGGCEGRARAGPQPWPGRQTGAPERFGSVTWAAC